jgi:hypothetical protein
MRRRRNEGGHFALEAFSHSSQADRTVPKKGAQETQRRLFTKLEVTSLSRYVCVQIASLRTLQAHWTLSTQRNKTQATLVADCQFLWRALCKVHRMNVVSL